MTGPFNRDPLLFHCVDCGKEHRTTHRGLNRILTPYLCGRCRARRYQQERRRLYGDDSYTTVGDQRSKLPPDAPREPRRLPMTRGECQDGPRPCPYATCRHHLAFEVTQHGRLVENFPGVEIWEMAETCSLDVAERGTHTLNEVATFLGVQSRERSRQLEDKVSRELERNEILRELWR